MTKTKKKITALDVLKRMKALLRKGWTQGASARSASRRPVNIDSPKASYFCLFGAEHRALEEFGNRSPQQQVERLIVGCIRTAAGHGGIATFNDAKGRTKKEILAVVSCAIKKATPKAV